MRTLFLMWIALLAVACQRAEPKPDPSSAAQAAAVEPVNTAHTPSEACQTCQKQHCSAVLAACTGTECNVLRGCIRNSKCGDPAHDTLVPCYCGSAAQDDCLFGKATPNGPCKALIEAGAKSTNPLEVGQRYFDMSYTTGQAIQLANCEQTFCKQCL
jgi:hypothetical protein